MVILGVTFAIAQDYVLLERRVFYVAQLYDKCVKFIFSAQLVNYQLRENIKLPVYLVQTMTSTWRVVTQNDIVTSTVPS